MKIDNAMWHFISLDFELLPLLHAGSCLLRSPHSNDKMMLNESLLRRLRLCRVLLSSNRFKTAVSDSHQQPKINFLAK
jgi:hypothetical protein